MRAISVVLLTIFMLGLLCRRVAADVTAYFGEADTPGPRVRDIAPATDIAPDDTHQGASHSSRPAPRPSEPSRGHGARRCIPRSAVRFIRAANESADLVLMGCDGRPDAATVAELSVLARPWDIERPARIDVDSAEWVARGIRRLHPGILERLQVVADRFRGHAIQIVAGSRPDAERGSRHRYGLAIDFRVVDVDPHEVHSVIRGFERTGAGLHLQTEVIHLDIRARRTHWMDYGTARRPRIVRLEALPSLQVAREGDETSVDVVDADTLADPIERALRRLELVIPNP